MRILLLTLIGICLLALAFFVEVQSGDRVSAVVVLFGGAFFLLILALALDLA